MIPDSESKKPTAGPAASAISIVMPLWNKEATVARAIVSVLAQTVQDWELIIVNDGSTDGGVEVGARFQDPRIRIVHQENQGVSAARNRGVAEARADWVAFLDADDEWMPDFLETICRLRDDFPEAAVCGTGYYCKHGSETPKQAPVQRLIGRTWEGILEDYFLLASTSAPPLWTSAVAVRRDALEGIGGFPVGIASGEDLLTWARLAVRHPIAYSSAPKAVFWYPAALAERPGRAPDPADLVGRELAALHRAAPASKRPSIAKYIGHWYDMRAVIYLRLGNGRASREEISRAVSWGGRTPKRVAVFTLALWPGGACAIYPLLKKAQRVLSRPMKRSAIHP